MNRPYLQLPGRLLDFPASEFRSKFGFLVYEGEITRQALVQTLCERLGPERLYCGHRRYNTITTHTYVAFKVIKNRQSRTARNTFVCAGNMQEQVRILTCASEWNAALQFLIAIDEDCYALAYILDAASLYNRVRGIPLWQDIFLSSLTLHEYEPVTNWLSVQPYDEVDEWVDRMLNMYQKRWYSILLDDAHSDVDYYLSNLPTYWDGSHLIVQLDESFQPDAEFYRHLESLVYNYQIEIVWVLAPYLPDEEYMYHGQWRVFQHDLYSYQSHLTGRECSRFVARCERYPTDAGTELNCTVCLVTLTPSTIPSTEDIEAIEFGDEQENGSAPLLVNNLYEDVCTNSTINAGENDYDGIIIDSSSDIDNNSKLDKTTSSFVVNCTNVMSDEYDVNSEGLQLMIATRDVAIVEVSHEAPNSEQDNQNCSTIVVLHSDIIEDLPVVTQDCSIGSSDIPNTIILQRSEESDIANNVSMTTPLNNSIGHSLESLSDTSTMINGWVSNIELDSSLSNNIDSTDINNNDDESSNLSNEYLPDIDDTIPGHIASIVDEVQQSLNDSINMSQNSTGRIPNNPVSSQSEDPLPTTRDIMSLSIQQVAQATLESIREREWDRVQQLIRIQQELTALMEQYH